MRNLVARSGPIALVNDRLAADQDQVTGVLLACTATVRQSSASDLVDDSCCRTVVRGGDTCSSRFVRLELPFKGYNLSDDPRLVLNVDHADGSLRTATSLVSRGTVDMVVMIIQRMVIVGILIRIFFVSMVHSGPAVIVNDLLVLHRRYCVQILVR